MICGQRAAVGANTADLPPVIPVVRRVEAEVDTEFGGHLHANRCVVSGSSLGFVAGEAQGADKTLLDLRQGRFVFGAVAIKGSGRDAVD